MRPTRHGGVSLVAWNPRSLVLLSVVAVFMLLLNEYAAAQQAPIVAPKAQPLCPSLPPKDRQACIARSAASAPPSTGSFSAALENGTLCPSLPPALRPTCFSSSSASDTPYARRVIEREPAPILEVHCPSLPFEQRAACLASGGTSQAPMLSGVTVGASAPTFQMHCPSLPPAQRAACSAGPGERMAGSAGVTGRTQDQASVLCPSLPASERTNCITQQTNDALRSE